MFKIMRCSEVPSKLLYDTFTEGFSDYIIQMSLTEEGFFNYFFGREGNQLEHSFIAIDTAPQEGQGDDSGLGVGLGVALGGIRIYDGVKTLRCGGFCVVPKWRGSAVASELLQHHMAEAKAQQCGQLYLEVIDKNERAQRFYQKHGYTFGKPLWYYQKDISAEKGATATEQQVEQASAQAPRIEAISIETISFEDLKDFRERLPELHINWQNEMASLEKLKGSHWGLYLGDQLIGALSQYMSAIQFIALLEPYRGQGYGRSLMAHAISQAAQTQSTVRFSFADNPSYEGFLKHLGFIADQLSQLEMYYPL